MTYLCTNVTPWIAAEKKSRRKKYYRAKMS
jgi:hypothetical protein